ncbi:hypothetical protein SAMD00019534_095970 [Acytostelium subglobosum LB1]|uniref:hypothetical protein n=1 Tax=Acytostelium subglobosum LB1 TaxID=1410327 RepID=UPI000644FE7F|nr:hypothetical protein SAMD00019534_095970 [Acytostelium subglobosum LB1]GAM26422.1 hypothetical protein SAMD00019534_095970 [Acytostelium subglobosum LB1]|eukprot:XP_012750518.1 hypothetical protein SAMD00019534_095970 [Acytostelium subglobosum LB1]
MSSSLEDNNDDQSHHGADESVTIINKDDLQHDNEDDDNDDNVDVVTKPLLSLSKTSKALPHHNRSMSNNSDYSGSSSSNNNNNNNNTRFVTGSGGEIIIITSGSNNGTPTTSNNNNNIGINISNSSNNMNSSYQSDASTNDYSTNTMAAIDREAKTRSEPFTFHHSMMVVIMVVIYLMLITFFMIMYRFAAQSTFSYYMFLIVRPLPMVPLLLIIPLYGINDEKTRRYSICIAVALVLSFISDVLLSAEVNASAASRAGTGYSPGLYYASFTFTLLARVAYTTAFVVGIGKSIKIRLFHAIPFYAFSATMVLMIVFSKQIAPVLIPPHHPFGASSGLDLSAKYTHTFDSYTTTTLSSSTPGDSEASSYIETSSSTSPIPQLDTGNFTLVIIYAIVESTMLWRALALVSSFPGTNPTRALLFLSVIGATVFAITDTLIIISNYYYPIQGIFYLSAGGFWLGHSLIVFSIPRRMDFQDYLNKYIKTGSRRTASKRKSMRKSQQQQQQQQSSQLYQSIPSN